MSISNNSHRTIDKITSPTLWDNEYPSTSTTTRTKVNIPDIDNLTIVSRIGSPSTEGEVYLVSVEEYRVAMKLLPVCSDSDYAKNNNEITIATLLSNLVLKGSSKYFPIVHGSGFCGDVTYYDNKFQESGSRYFSLKAIVEQFPPSHPNHPWKRISHLYKDCSISMICEILNIPKIPIHNCSSNILFSELADIDLKRWITEDHTVDEWFSVLRHIMTGISDMHKAGVLHNDLHLGNILIYHGIPLIHDFGKSMITESNDEYIDDYRRFFYSLHQGVLQQQTHGNNIPNEVIKFLEHDVVKNLDSQEDIRNIQDIFLEHCFENDKFISYYRIINY